jgi:DNA-binding CsgD family transcriptional regulator
LEKALRRIVDAETLRELWRATRNYFRDQGFNGIAYFIPRQPFMSRSMVVNGVGHGFPKEVIEAYRKFGLGGNDPVPRYALEHGTPIRWTDAFLQADPTPEQLQFREEMHAVNLGDGYSLPVFGSGGRNACLQVGFPRDDSVVDNAPVREMHIVAQAAHTRLCAMWPDSAEVDNPLSGRELEILGWIARGKSNSVIAHILGLSQSTVDTYLRRIYEKLDVSDRTSAAVKGIGMGLIVA